MWRFWWCLVLLASGGLAAQESLPRRLLVIDVDDVGVELLEEVAPPFLVSLDRSARRYDRFYTAPVCSPTRAAMNLGAYASHPGSGCFWLIGKRSSFEMPTEGPLVPLAKVLADGGIAAHKLGKWHLAPKGDPTHPIRAGYRHYDGVIANLNKHRGYLREFEWQSTRDREPAHPGDLTASESELAIAAMREGVRFISLSYHAIHAPFQAVPNGDCPASDAPDFELAACMLRALDRELARVHAVASQLGYHVILFSDNGGVQVLGGEKGSLHEAGIRTRMWVSGPDVVPGQDPSLVVVNDVFATALEFFGLRRPPGVAPHSISFLPTWQGESSRRRSVYAERFGENGGDPRADEANWQRVAIGPRFKLRRGPEGWRLFHLPSDPEGRSDLLPILDALALSASEREELALLRAQLLALDA